MMPYQKYPSIYKQYPSQEQVPQVPQTPFDMAYGSSLLPRQLFVGSPFIQVQSPLPSPVHHGSFQLQRTPGGIPNPNQQSYFMASPASAPKLNFPPESARKRGLNYHLTLQRHNSASGRRINTDETPSKGKFKSSSSSSSSLNESTFDNQQSSENQNIYDNGAISSNSSLYNLYQSGSSRPPLLTKVSSNFQISRQPTRSLILLNINPDLSITEFLNSITFGPIENARIVENYPDEDHHSIVSAFLKIETCLNFYNNILTYLSKFKTSIKSPELSINFIATKKLLPFISNAINNDGATRNVYIGNLKSLENEVDEAFLYNEFSSFGLIDKIDLITKKSENKQPAASKTENNEEEPEKEEKKESELDEEETNNQDQFAFIHFTNIASAIKAVEQLSLSPTWSDTKIFYGTDRCSINNNSLLLRSITDEQDEVISQISEEDEDELINENEELYAQHYPHAHHIRQHSQQFFIPQQFPNDEYVSNALNQKNITAQAVATNAGGADNAGNRTVYLGNLDQKTKPEDICNVVRGGVLQNIKHFSTKRICFLTFIEPVAAAQFYANGNIDGITLHGRKLKIGWGNHSGPLPNSIALAVTVGASRNVYIGIKDEDLENEDVKLPSEQILRQDFSKFGEIEQINFFKNDRCVFLNFLNISNAIKVVDDANGTSTEKFHEYFNNKYRNLKISFGKDRCGNPPKTKKSKKKNKKSSKKQNGPNQEESMNGESNEKATDDQVEQLSEDFMNSMGITSTNNINDYDNDNDNDNATDSVTVTSSTNESQTEASSDAFGITTTSCNAQQVDADEHEEQHQEADPAELSDSSSSSEALDIIVSQPDPRPYTPSRNPSDEMSSKVNNKKQQQQQQQQQRRSKKKQAYSPAMSSRLSSASLNSLNYFQYQEPEAYVYKQVPFAPPIPHRSFSRGSSKTNLSSYKGPMPMNGGHGAQPQLQQYHSNGFTTSGSQVMAQYLAQSQHANMIYAANVLNTTDDYGYEDDDAGYYHPGYNNRGGHRRR